MIALALGLEAAVGYPSGLYARIGHPATWIGALIAWLDGRLNKPAYTFRLRRATGIGALGALLVIAGFAGLALHGVAGLAPWPVALLLGAMLASSLLAQRSLDEHVAKVRDGLGAGLDEGRHAVSMIVGRNPETLDEAGIARAAIESLAENASDGIVAPAFWIAVFGLPGGVLYKAVNTADSMIGHKSERYRAFGWAAARSDDLVNLPASRLTALLFIVAAIGPGTSSRGALRAVWRDAGKHRSPNAGWPEAAMAGALGLRLAGPRIYGETLVDDHWMGDGPSAATAADIGRALGLYRRAMALQVALYAGLAGLALAFL